MLQTTQVRKLREISLTYKVLLPVPITRIGVRAPRVAFIRYKRPLCPLHFLPLFLVRARNERTREMRLRSPVGRNSCTDQWGPLLYFVHVKTSFNRCAHWPGLFTYAPQMRCRLNQSRLGSPQILGGSRVPLALSSTRVAIYPIRTTTDAQTISRLK